MYSHLTDTGNSIVTVELSQKQEWWKEQFYSPCQLWTSSTCLPDMYPDHVWMHDFTSFYIHFFPPHIIFLFNTVILTKINPSASDFTSFTPYFWTSLLNNFYRSLPTDLLSKLFTFVIV